jgi:16S rRNA (cytidine1402-2'-O)-methyltransferase
MSLYICSTPIGNLEDISLRCLRILKEVDIIACEDTRHTKKILNKYEISQALTSYHKFNIKAKTSYLVNLLKEGKSIALVSDSGTPGISDPGFELIKEAINNNIKIIPIPGPSSPIVALTLSGFQMERFLFLGYLPKKKGKRQKTLEEAKRFSGSVIFLESPYRLIKALEDVKLVFGESIKIAVARELTKVFEELIRGTAKEVAEHFSTKKPKGEIVVVVDNVEA